MDDLPIYRQSKDNCKREHDGKPLSFGVSQTFSDKAVNPTYDNFEMRMELPWILGIPLFCICVPGKQRVVADTLKVNLFPHYTKYAALASWGARISPPTQDLRPIFPV